jgi:glycogen phosphorylase
MKKSITPRIAYFSMEIALEPDIPTYSGGLGILAGDTLRSAADLGTPLVAITLAYRKGYFRQILDPAGNQFEQPQEWDPASQLPEAGPHVEVEIEGRRVVVRAWKYTITGISGDIVPVYLLDTDVPENAEFDRGLTDSLYGGDQRYRLAQEIVLGLGGFQLLQKLYPSQIETYHMNEGHSALLSLGLLEKRLEQSFAGRLKQLDITGVRHMCVFTTHTPVPAGHDQFPRSLVIQTLGREQATR